MHDRIAHIEKQLAAAVDLNTQRGALLYLNARPSLQPHVSEDEAINAYARVINSYSGVYENVGGLIGAGSIVLGIYALSQQFIILGGIAVFGILSCASLAKEWVSKGVTRELDEAFQSIAAANKNRRPAALIDRHAPALPPQVRNGRASVSAYFDVPPQR